MGAQITATKALAAILIISFLTATLAHIHAHTTYDVIDLKKACLFLEHQYVPEIGLLRAAYEPWIDDHNRVYINDNILAARALAVCGNEELANKLLMELASEYEDYLETGRHEVLIGQAISDIPLDKDDTVLMQVGNLTIIAEIRGTRVFEGWENFADWLLLESINSLIKGNKARAQELFRKAMNMWDGYGLNDSVAQQKGRYSVYKLALAIYAYRALGEPIQYENKIAEMLSYIARAQDPNSGGIHTDYVVKDGIPDYLVSGTNVETTSIVILALYSNYPVKSGASFASMTYQSTAHEKGAQNERTLLGNPFTTLAFIILLIAIAIVVALTLPSLVRRKGRSQNRK